MEFVQIATPVVADGGYLVFLGVGRIELRMILVCFLFSIICNRPTDHVPRPVATTLHFSPFPVCQVIRTIVSLYFKVLRCIPIILHPHQFPISIQNDGPRVGNRVASRRKECVSRIASRPPFCDLYHGRLIVK
jgi:hypothetical protein